jgi:serine/threonine-protein kinase
MTFAPGTSLGPYRITGQLGAGGMGEVYRATDSKLGREVAIKTLPAALASDKDRLARFEREAKLLATLNHPHIAAVYSLDEHEGTLYLAMELVEGQTLEQKLKAGALSVDDALRLALQIAQALEAAHDKGVVHRDLKPANVMVTPQGVVKVLDFGLAKAFSNEPEGVAENSPALSLAMTQAGLVLGTAAYMAPEQASAQAADQRADIWAFGVVVYEMLSGLPLFSGESVPHILADVLKTEPDWTRLPRHLHPRLKLMLERCLEKKPRNRYHSIADARVDIEAVLRDPDGGISVPEHAAASHRSLAVPVTAAVGATLLVAALAGFAWIGLGPEDPALITRLSFEVDGELGPFDSINLSPDGRRVVYGTSGELYSRRLDQDVATVIAGSAGGQSPIFSADGDSLEFSTDDRQIKVVGFSGDAPRTLATVEAPALTGAWTGDTLYFGLAGGYPLYELPDVGGEPAVFAERLEYDDLDYPDFLPNGQWVLFTANRAIGNWSQADIVAQNLETGDRHVVLGGGHFARYSPTGHLVFARNGTLYAIRFDAERAESIGAAVPIVQSVSTDETSGVAKYAFAANGTLVYVPGDVQQGTNSTVRSIDLEGAARSVPAQPRYYVRPRVSPDGTRIAVEVTEAGTDVTHIWIMDRATGNAVQLTLSGTENRYPVFTRDGQDILFVSNRDGGYAIYRKAANGVGDATRVLDGSDELLPTDMLAGDVLVYQDAGPDGSKDILTFDLASGGPPAAYLATPANEHSARISPDGAWMAYVSDATGTTRVYARPYPYTAGGQRILSEAVGLGPLWAPDASAVYYLGPAPGDLMAVPVQITDGSLASSVPRVLFRFATRFEIPGLESSAPYDVLPDGEGFIAVQVAGLAAREDSSVDTSVRSRINVVLNWFEELERLLPAE